MTQKKVKKNIKREILNNSNPIIARSDAIKRPNNNRSRRTKDLKPNIVIAMSAKNDLIDHSTEA